MSILIYNVNIPKVLKRYSSARPNFNATSRRLASTELRFRNQALSLFFLREPINNLIIRLQYWILQQMDTGLQVQEGYCLSCSYLLARTFVQMLKRHLEPVTLPSLDPRRFPSWLFAESGSLAVSDLADVEFFSPQWHSFNRRGGEWPTQEQLVAWQLGHSPRRWEMRVGYPLGKEGNCGRSKFNLGECLSLQAIA